MIGASPSPAVFVVWTRPAGQERARRLAVHPLEAAGHRCHLMPVGDEPGALQWLAAARAALGIRPVPRACWLIRDDHWVADATMLGSILEAIPSSVPALCANAFPVHGDPNWLGLPYIRDEVRFNSNCVVMNRRALEALAEFLDRHPEAGTWAGGPDGLLAAFVGSVEDLRLACLPPSVRSPLPGMRRRLSSHDVRVALWGGVDGFRERALDLEREDAGTEPAILDGERHPLNGLPFRSVSSFSASGRSGMMFHGRPERIFVAPDVDTRNSIGLHAPSLLRVTVQTDGYYHLGGSFAMSATARQGADFYLSMDSCLRMHELVSPRTLVRFDLPIGPGRHVIFFAAEPDLLQENFAHSCLIEPTFVRISRAAYLAYELFGPRGERWRA